MSSIVVPAYPWRRKSVRAAPTTAARERTTRGSSARGRGRTFLTIALTSEIVYRRGDNCQTETRMRLLRWGMMAGPFYLAVGLAQAFTRQGFDFARHPLSVLANGPGGWIQTANFVITGAMVIAAAVGVQRV